MNYIIILFLVIIIIVCILLKPFTEYFEDINNNINQDSLDNYEIILCYLYNGNPRSKLNMINFVTWRRNEQLLRNELNKLYSKNIKVFHYNYQTQLNFIVNRENPVLWSLISPDCLPNKDLDTEKQVNTTINNNSFDANGNLIASNNYLTGEINSKLLLCMIPLNEKCKYTNIPVKWNIPINNVLGKEKSITDANFVNLLSNVVLNRVPIQLPNQDLLTTQINNPNPELIIYNNIPYYDKAIQRGILQWTKHLHQINKDNINNYEIHLIYVYNANPSNSFNFYQNVWIPQKQNIMNKLRQSYPNIIINDYRMTIDTKELAKEPLLWSMSNMYARQGNPTTIFRQGVVGNGFQFDNNGNFIQSSYQQTAMNPQLVLILIPKNKNTKYTQIPIKWQIPDGIHVKGGPILDQNNIVNELDNYIKNKIPIDIINNNISIESLPNLMSDTNMWRFNPSYKDPIVDKAIQLMNV